MPISYDLLSRLQGSRPDEAWQAILDHTWNVCSADLDPSKAEVEVRRRDAEIGATDHFLATAAWDLWASLHDYAPLTSSRLIQWWSSIGTGRAVLVLDALSLRETPWLLQGAKARGFDVVNAMATVAGLPADTTPFAKALGFAQRSALANNGAGNSHKFAGARTECTEAPWKDCTAMIGSQPDWFFWHQWPDDRLHELGEPGKGLATLTQEVVQQLTSDDFWEFVARLAHGRRLVITADHGYAASGQFSDAGKDQSDYLKDTFKAGRWTSGAGSAGEWVPPLDIMLHTPQGRVLFANGRRKWKASGGYPTLTHGGLTVLEVAVPFIELKSSKG